MNAVTFTANGNHLVAGDSEGVCVWRVQDGKRMAAWKAGDVLCLAVSTDGRWIAAGTGLGRVIVWDAETYEQVFEHWELFPPTMVTAVDFSPDSTRLVAAWDSTAMIIWNFLSREQVQSLPQPEQVFTAKYSPQGDRIATASKTSVRVWDSNDGRLLVDIKVHVISSFNSGLLWFNNYIFVTSTSKIEQIDASIGSTVSEWSVPGVSSVSCIALPQHGKFIAYSTWDTITFWDTSTYSQLLCIQRRTNRAPVAFSTDDRSFAFVAPDMTMTVKRLSSITVGFMPCARV